MSSAVVLTAVLLGGCDSKSSGSSETPAASATSNSATPTPATPSPAPSSSAAEPTKKAAEGPKDHAARQKALSEAFASHDAKKISALYADDAVVKTWGNPDVKGKDAIEKDAEKMFGVFKDAKVETGRIFEKDKHTYVAESVFMGTNTGDAPEMGIPKATDKKVGIVGASWIQVGDDGLIKEEHRYHDQITALGQLKPDPKVPVRAVVTEPPNGTEKHVAKDKPSDDETKNTDALKKFVAAMNANKIDDAMKLVGKDYTFDDYSSPAILKGDKAFKDMLGTYTKAFPDLKVNLGDNFATGDFVVLEEEFTGTQKGQLGIIKPTNKSMDVHQLEIDEFKDGKFVKGWAYMNTAEMLGELGVLKAEEKAIDKAADKEEKKEKKEKK